MDAYQNEFETGLPQASFASSGLLSTQILQGAPFELFLSADDRTVSRLVNAGKTKTKPIGLATGTLSLVARDDLVKNLNEPLSMSMIGESLAVGISLKISIPNPRHAPYGIAAQQALTAEGLWPIPRGSLLNAENASQALQYVLSGAASFAIVPTTLVAQTSFDIKVASIGADSYLPIVHHLALLAPARDNARKLHDWLRTPKALNIMMRFGLAAP
jgi:molybdate transport system substrate-binding protein